MTTTTDEMILLQVDPRKLQVNPANVRTKTVDADTKRLAESIAQVGVLVPLTVRTNGTADSFVIVAGERRALAAIQAGVATVPVIVRSDVDDTRAELTAMLIENLHREGLTPADEAKGYEQLAAFGVSIDDIAQLTGRETDRVSMGVAVAKSKVATDIAVKHPLSFDHLVVIAEFDGDKRAVDKLVRSAESDPRYFGHLVQDLRRTADRKVKGKAERERLKAAGVTVVSKAFGYDLSAKNGVRLDYLKDDANNEIKPGVHKKCPGHAAAIGFDGNAVYGCTDPAKYGHKAQRGYSSTSPTPKVDPAKEAAAKLKAEQDADALAASTIVRRQFVRELLGRKTPPKGLLGFVVPLVIQYGEDINPGDLDLVADFTGIKKASIDRSRPYLAFLELTKGANDERLQMVLLCFITAAIESEWAPYLLAPREWESNVVEAKYLQYLDTLGYGLSDIEQRIIASAFPPAKKSKAAKHK